MWGEQHARVFARRPDTQLVAIVGRTAGRAQQRPAAYGTTAYTDIEEMLRPRGRSRNDEPAERRSTLRRPYSWFAVVCRCWSRNRWCSTSMRPSS